MQIFRQVEPWRAYLKMARSGGHSLGLVPTMGALHDGHLSLVNQSKSDNGLTVCSIFVNPAQFNNTQDLLNYPRTLEQDLSMLQKTGCDVAFCPDNDEMYRDRAAMSFDFGALDKVFEGEFRPGHFSGVALVVSKLLHIIEPDRAYFGLKDFQQFRIISTLVRDLKFNVQVVGMPIIREPDGLAMSSRNRLLAATERKRATILHRCLQQTREGLMRGQPFEALRSEAAKQCADQQVELEYLSLADQSSLAPVGVVGDPASAILLIAARVGQVRLIDNLFLVDNAQQHLYTRNA